MSSPRLGALVILLALVWSADAHAAKLVRDGSELQFTGDPTLTTDPFITKNDSSGKYEISNSSQAISPIPAACEYVLSSSQRWVSCPAGFTHLKITLGSATDSVLAPEVDVPMTINAGDGDDTITGGLLADVINGQAGHDTLNGDGVFGGPTSHDEINGGIGDDSLRGRVGRDELRGGPGFDEAYYLDRAEAVTISLNGVADDGAAGESDNVFADVEGLQGGAGDDVLTGNDQPNALNGEGGADTLTGGGGVDAFRAGAGADHVRARDGLVENVNCGDADDDVTADLVDVLSNCEAVDASGALQPDADGDGLDDPADCNDLDATIRPGLPDVAENGIDEDCSGADGVNFDRDADGTPRPQDCDDGSAAVRPGVPDVPGNGVDEDCVGGDLVDLDRDDDGFARPRDCDDADPRINPGARDIRGNRVDEDCAGGPDPFARVRAEIVNSWAVFSDHTEVRKLGVRSAGGRATVVVLCDGRGCPFARKRFADRDKLDLRRSFRGRELAPGTVVELRVLREGMVGKVVRYRVRALKVPRSDTLCLAPGKKRPREC